MKNELYPLIDSNLSLLNLSQSDLSSVKNRLISLNDNQINEYAKNAISNFIFSEKFNQHDYSGEKPCPKKYLSLTNSIVNDKSFSFDEALLAIDVLCSITDQYFTELVAYQLLNFDK